MRFIAGMVAGAVLFIGAIAVAEEVDLLPIVQDNTERIEALERHIECTEYRVGNRGYQVYEVDMCATRRYVY